MSRKNLDLVAACAIAILGCALIAVHAPAPATVACGIGLIAVPGYIWTEVLLKSYGPVLERVMIGIGLAFMLPIFGGLALYAVGIPLHRATWVGLLAGETVVGVVALAILRTISDKSEIEQKPARRVDISARHALTYGIAAVFAVATVAIAVDSADKQAQPGYTQLWMSPVKNEAVASLGVNNQQGGTVAYQLQLLNKGRVKATWNLTLANGKTWQRDIPYPSAYSVTANLYRLPNLSKPYRTVGNNQ